MVSIRIFKKVLRIQLKIDILKAKQKYLGKINAFKMIDELEKINNNR